jgi:hypothetical protein
VEEEEEEEYDAQEEDLGGEEEEDLSGELSWRSVAALGRLASPRLCSPWR